MDKILKVITIVGTRPEIIRLSRVIHKLDEYCDHYIVHTGQNFDYELNQVFFDELDIRMPDYFLNSSKSGVSAAETIGNIISSIDGVLVDQKPDAVLILGDTNSSLAVVSAKRRKIPIFHMEAGNRSYDLRVPEEINRRIVDHTSDINLTYSKIARENLLREGLPPDQIINTGSPMNEVLDFYMPKINKSDALKRLELSKYSYFLISSHREENIDNEKNFLNLINILNTLAEDYKIPLIVSTHPRTRQRIKNSQLTFHPLIKLLKPLGFIDYVHLQMKAKAVISDSGTITEESSILNFPALNIRETHERPEGMEEASVIMTGMDINIIKQGLKILDNQGRASKRTCEIVEDYKAPNVSEKVLRIILSYTDYINRVVWKKY
ncbi:UDP-N-acetylglucosamine 2-epimerase (non-hydrolyzing) [Gammaproteobacteria bacterium]|nr:UDP-N-acetylglucosamine 2-epimerase (non-hydrolyzing) [Gammaproteobacteria bacterium]MDA9575292.1 UDP-N-acetylglucosamine 2-epimerase (non-hydrolyzing) [Gammaproteobacteria bacterium]MDC3411144.1 UDP-N-acetylglucosamine 2-epimerase (non-hydrolyzing) [Gammaproteobacteria bacterium]